MRLPAQVNILWLLTLLLFACRGTESKNNRVLAKVGEKRLFESDVIKKIQNTPNKQDSLWLVERFIKQWTEEQILVSEAKERLLPEEQNKDAEIESYRNALLIHELEKKILNSMPIYSPTVAEIKSYYQQNRKEFELKKNILRLNYIKVKQSAAGVAKAREWFLSDISTDRRRVQDYARLIADNYFFDDNIWLTAEDIQKEIPVWSINPEDYARNQRKTILQDATYFYFINLIDFRVSTEAAPFDMVFQEIKNILVNKRKVQIVEEFKNNLIRRAMSGKMAEIYP